jgi:hypothetical protein
MLTRTLFFAVVLTAAGSAANAANAGDSADAAALHDESRGGERVTVNVPSVLQGQGYVLGIGSEEIPLNGPKVETTEASYRRRIELLDSGGRLLADESRVIEPDMLLDVTPRSWRISLWTGETVVNGSPLRSILHDDQLNEQTVTFDWQPSALGLRVEVSTLGSDESHLGVDSRYESEQLRLAGTYEIGGLPLRLHLIGSLGALFASHHETLDDGVVSQSGSGSNFGGLAGLDLMWPIYGGFWVGLKGTLSYQRVELSAFDFKHNFVERGAQLGASYAF